MHYIPNFSNIFKIMPSDHFKNPSQSVMIKWISLLKKNTYQHISRADYENKHTQE